MFEWTELKEKIQNSEELSVIKKKSNSIAFYFFPEGTLKDKWHHAYVNTDDNL